MAKEYSTAQQNEVAELHRALDIPIGDTPGLRRVDIDAGLIAAAAKRAIEGAETGELVRAIEGLCDLMYVAYSAALDWGVDLGPFFDEIHRSNMTKVQPGEWQRPDIAGVLRAQIMEAGNYTSAITRSGTAALGG